MNIIARLNKAVNPWIIIPSLTQDELEEVILLSADSYYNSSITLISDEIYDVLTERLRQLDPESAVLNYVGAPIKGKKVELPYWMGSMNKIKADDAVLQRWLKTYEGPYLISDKMDGISCLFTRIDGERNLFTRGDGTKGQNVSHLLKYANMSLDQVPDDINVAIRGELIMTTENFEKYAEEMSNARNMVAGVVNSKPEKVVKKHASDVDFITYEIIEPLMDPLKQLATLKKWKTQVVPHDIYEDITMDILEWILSKRKKKTKYDIDGVIVTDNNRHSRNQIGNPPYSFAYKGTTPTADVKVIDVIWKPSKDGILVPRIQYEKVKLSQVWLEFATAFNAKFIVENKLGKGAVITIIRSGDVIPYIMAVIKPAKAPGLPTEYEYEWDKNRTHIVLVDKDADTTVIIQRLTKFLRDIGVENMSEGIVTRLVTGGYDDIIKIMKMTVDDFLELDGFQETLANKLHRNLHQQLNKMTVLQLMNASNCFGRGFGERKLKKILNVYPDIVTEYTTGTSHTWTNRLMELDGFDTITVGQFFEGLNDFQKFYRLVNRIVHVKPYVSNIKKGGKFKDQVIVFTGFRNKAWQTYIESEGGRVSSAVSGNTTLVVYNDGEESSIKYKRALKLGVPTITKSRFGKKHGLDM